MVGVYMKRPRTFEMGTHTVKIRYHKKVMNGDKPVAGLVVPSKNTIYIATENVCEDQIMHALWHEIGHFIMIQLNQWKLNNDETFIDTLGSYLAQVHKSIK